MLFAVHSALISFPNCHFIPHYPMIFLTLCSSTSVHFGVSWTVFHQRILIFITFLSSFMSPTHEPAQITDSFFLQQENQLYVSYFFPSLSLIYMRTSLTPWHLSSILLDMTFWWTCFKDQVMLFWLHSPCPPASIPSKKKICNNLPTFLF